MALENKLGLTSSADLAREEERISKKKAVELFEKGILDNLLYQPCSNRQPCRFHFSRYGRAKCVCCDSYPLGTGGQC